MSQAAPSFSTHVISSAPSVLQIKTNLAWTGLKETPITGHIPHSARWHKPDTSRETPPPAWIRPKRPFHQLYDLPHLTVAASHSRRLTCYRRRQSMDNLNSSDFEFDEPIQKRPNTFPGQQSIQQIVERAQEDRYKSKRTAKQMQYGTGAPGTRYLQSLWAARFEAFRKNVLNQDIETGFSGDDLIRFFDSILGVWSLSPSGSFDHPADLPFRQNAASYSYETSPESEYYEGSPRKAYGLQTISLGT